MKPKSTACPWSRRAAPSILVGARGGADLAGRVPSLECVRPDHEYKLTLLRDLDFSRPPVDPILWVWSGHCPLNARLHDADAQPHSGLATESPLVALAIRCLLPSLRHFGRTYLRLTESVNYLA